MRRCTGTPSTLCIDDLVPCRCKDALHFSSCALSRLVADLWVSQSWLSQVLVSLQDE